MNPTIKARIEKIKNGEVPKGYKRSKIGIVPTDWKERKLKNYFTRLTRKNAENNQNVLTISAQYGLISQEDFFNKSVASENKSNYFLLLKGDFAYNKSYSNGYPYGAIKRLEYYDKGIVSPLYICMEPQNSFVADYFVQYFEGGLLNGEIHAFAQEGARNHGLLNIAVDDFFNTNVVVPCEAEQQKIAEILATQDKVIELKEKLLKEKQRQKKYLMQQLLTKKKRLPGFSGEWKCVRLGELGCFYPGLSGKTKEDFGSGKPYIPYKNIFNNQKIDCDFFEYVKIKENETQTKVKYGDIFFTTSSEILSEVGMSSVMLDSVEELYLNSFCTGFRLNDFNSIHPEYAAHYFRGEVFRIALNKISQGITRFNLSKNGLSKMSLTLPPIEEQLAIAQILSTVDKEIEFLKKGIEQEKLKKKSLMQLLLTGIVRVNEFVL